MERGRVADALKPGFLTGLFVVWQLCAVLLVTVGYWPPEVAWVTFLLTVAFIAVFDPRDSVNLLVASLSFFVVLPNTRSETLSSWRLLFLILFVRWLVTALREAGSLPSVFRRLVVLPWDRYVGWFLVLALLVSLPLAVRPWESMRQLAFLLNIYLFYLVVANTVRTEAHLRALVRWAVVSLTVLITLGFVQLLLTFTTGLDTFWVFWASNVSRPYYGSYFSSVALYSNSWFSFNGVRELRMFSVMPDSQSFAYLTVFGIGFGTVLTATTSERVKRWLWSGIRYAGLALVLSGTRAVWVGMLAPLTLLSWGYYRRSLRSLSRKFLVPLLVILALFAVSPLINRGLAYLRFGDRFQENFIERAKSIYDLREASNVGRLKIWGESLRYWVSHPLGTGLGNFESSLSPGVGERYNLPERYVSAHSIYLQLLVELGPLGLLLALWFLGDFFVRTWRYVRGSASPTFLSLIVFMAGTVVLWLATAGLFDVTILNDKVLIMFSVLLAATGLVLTGRIREGA